MCFIFYRFISVNDRRIFTDFIRHALNCAVSNSQAREGTRPCFLACTTTVCCLLISISFPVCRRERGTFSCLTNHSSDLCANMNLLFTQFAYVTVFIYKYSLIPFLHVVFICSIFLLFGNFFLLFPFSLFVIAYCFVQSNMFYSGVTVYCIVGVLILFSHSLL